MDDMPAYGTGVRVSDSRAVAEDAAKNRSADLQKRLCLTNVFSKPPSDRSKSGAIVQVRRLRKTALSGLKAGHRPTKASLIR
jgi:hypothetical protein